MTSRSCLAVALTALFLASCATVGIVRGRVVDAGSRAPIPHARIKVPGLHLEIEADSVGRFSFAQPRASGCYVIRVIFIGYGATFRTVHFPLASGTDLEIPVRGAAIPEWRGLYLQQCVASDSIHVLWGMDTVLVR